VIAEKLREMNPFATVEESTTETTLEVKLISTRFSAVVYGLDSFKEAAALNDACRCTNVPFYMLSTAGLFGFFFIDVGRELTFTHHKKALDIDETLTITDSRTLADYLQ
jgi:molybdopterin/thiamine biosynthesis adenylyltransferase